MRQVITSFAGLRAHEDSDDFVIGEVKDAKGFILSLIHIFVPRRLKKANGLFILSTSRMLNRMKEGGRSVYRIAAVSYTHLCLTEQTF